MAPYRIVGKSVPMQDAWEKATGQAKYAADLAFPGMLMGKILRSPYPHARIIHIDPSRAERLPGVKAVIVGGPREGEERGGDLLGMRPGPERILAHEKVRYIGDEVAAVAAISEDIAQEALEHIKVEYE